MNPTDEVPPRLPWINSADQRWVVWGLSLALVGFLLHAASLWYDGRWTVDIDDATRYRNPLTIDLNEASLAELANLPGIGPSLAETILEQRDRLGGFRTAADLEAIPGVGPKKLQVLRAYTVPLPDAPSHRSVSPKREAGEAPEPVD